eukprot:7767574-Pyramimonas_sp.AAC.1
MKICSRGAAVTPRRALTEATTPSSTLRPHAAASGSARWMWTQAPLDQIRISWNASKADSPCVRSARRSRK